MISYDEISKYNLNYLVLNYFKFQYTKKVFSGFGGLRIQSLKV